MYLFLLLFTIWFTAIEKMGDINSTLTELCLLWALYHGGFSQKQKQKTQQNKTKQNKNKNKNKQTNKQTQQQQTSTTTTTKEKTFDDKYTLQIASDVLHSYG